jgi:5-methyltetrahydrofolate--homocysteine methyltransferase
METRVSSATREVIIGPERPTVIVGERINPAGRKKLADSLKGGSMDMLRAEAAAQAQAGADILEVNVSAFGIEEPALLPQAVRAVMETVDLPLCIDSPDPEALAEALKVYRGKPLLNSVTGEEDSLRKVLPLVREHRTAVIGLLQDEEGTPRDSEKRVRIAHKIVSLATSQGIPREDVVIDCMAFAVGAYPESGKVLLETINRIRSELGLNMVVGTSNISYGLPNRGLLNDSLVSMAISAGVTCHIANASRIRRAVLASDLVMGRDPRARRYINEFRGSK